MLAELGVILLMFSLGIEFSLRKLARVGATAGFVAVVQCSLMVWLGYLIGQAFGWTWLASLYAGAVISISSTTIIVKAFEEQRIKGDFTQIVFGVLIVEDMIAILLIVILTALSAGESLGPVELAMQGGRLSLFLGVLTVVGLLTVPRAMRAIVRLDVRRPRSFPRSAWHSVLRFWRRRSAIRSHWGPSLPVALFPNQASSARSSIWCSRCATCLPPCSSCRSAC